MSFLSSLAGMWRDLIEDTEDCRTRISMFQLRLREKSLKIGFWVDSIITSLSGVSIMKAHGM